MFGKKRMGLYHDAVVWYKKKQKYIYPAGWQMTHWDPGKKRTAF